MGFSTDRQRRLYRFREGAGRAGVFARFQREMSIRWGARRVVDAIATGTSARVRSSCLCREAAKLKPVVIDEALTDYDAVKRARALGYSGVALKACKGIGPSLLMAAVC